ncbi:TIGR00730 family Rossman fold protein [Rhodohalobacter barkolensis]|uniref:Cytokinin riboside 5'-monophosphate phosphoribohydrolase n=1 Tax=Rhodohalobacter barkolensis TaxID=2053187 RepID=A0A2N0VF55_9BACT|nr:TIGR00730 family Rossman fold protein [Rhodohalobacter barkolensis]PKD42834.1 TIGR00730 family Rossman fold protein [Rhodohalobacter barkolensis]
MNICVYCGSSPGKNNVIIDQAKAFGRSLAEKNHNLIYGGSSLGIMGAIADAVMVNGGEVIGVIPENLFSKEVAHRGITRLITVKDMHQRKSHMAELADAFVAYPGGFGTMEELFEIITWNQIGILNKPVTIMNIDGYYDPLIEMIDHAVETGFIKPANRKIVQVAETINQCFEFCEQA